MALLVYVRQTTSQSRRKGYSLLCRVYHCGVIEQQPKISLLFRIGLECLTVADTLLRIRRVYEYFALPVIESFGTLHPCYHRSDRIKKTLIFCVNRQRVTAVLPCK